MVIVVTTTIVLGQPLYVEFTVTTHTLLKKNSKFVKKLKKLVYVNPLSYNDHLVTTTTRLRKPPYKKKVSKIAKYFNTLSVTDEIDRLYKNIR